MRDQTQNKPAASPRRYKMPCVTRLASLSAIITAGFVAVSSAPARAGFRYFSADNSIRATSPNIFDNASPDMEFSKLSDAFLNPAGEEAFANSRFLTAYTQAATPGSIIGVGFGDIDPIAQVSNSAPQATDTPPLLIPVPTAISSGLCGLLVLALLAVPRRLRRRLFQ
ncbi:MAG TPA: hypothetical protein VFC46_12260 [Humisphaera sp.]|nr:hypothetical protein [Humisphaera sp.]